MEENLLLAFLCCAVCVCYRAEGMRKLLGNETVPALIIFGDSIVDTGSNNDLGTPARANFPPYGRDFEGGRPTGRFSNGRVPSDFLAEELGIKRFLPAYKDPSLQPNDHLTGVSFASGGSGYDPLTSQILSVISLSDQILQFKEYIGKLKANFGEERTNFVLSKSLVLVVSGSNDIANSYFTTRIRKLQYDVPSYTDLMLQYATSFVKEIYGLGVRKIGVFSAPPLGCMPSQRTLFGGMHRECAQETNMASVLFNAKLAPQLDALNKILPQAKVVYIDVYNPLLNIINNPTKYGFEVVDRGCCGTGKIEVSILCNHLEPQTCMDETMYVFWDSYHPTERTYQILVEEVLDRYLSSFF